MPVVLRAALAVALAVLVLPLTACGGDEPPGAPAAGSRVLTVYSSLPLHGSSRHQSQDMVNAMKLALQEAGGKAGGLAVNYVSLDSAPAEARRWTSDQVLDNARKALRDFNTIAYIGEAESSATALSLPLLNEGGILQVSPSSTYIGLTQTGSRRRGEPERFYPSNVRTFARVVPADNVQAAALVGYMQAEGVQRLYINHDRDLAGTGLAGQVADLAASEGIAVLGNEDLHTGAKDLSGPAEKVAESGADAFLFAGDTQSDAARVFKAVGEAAPGVLLFGGDEVAESAFARALPAQLQRRMRITSPSLDPRVLPASARRWQVTFRSTFGRDPEPYAIFAYEAMSAVLQAVRDAGEKGNDRRAVVDAFFRIRNRRSVLGTYSIDAGGDTSLSRYAGRRVRDGRLVFDKVLAVGR